MTICIETSEKDVACPLFVFILTAFYPPVPWRTDSSAPAANSTAALYNFCHQYIYIP